MAEDFRVVSIADSALDVAKMNETHASGKPVIMRYLETRDPSLPVALADRKLTWFHLRRLRVSEYNHVIDASNVHDQRMRAFAIGVTKIDNFVPIGESGPRTWTPDGEQRSGVRTMRYFTDEQMDLVSPAFVDEVGEVVRYRSFLAHEPEVFYPPQQSSLQLWTARCVQAAASLVSASRPTSSEKPSPETPSTTNGGDPDTGASATESPSS